MTMILWLLGTVISTVMAFIVFTVFVTAFGLSQSIAGWLTVAYAVACVVYLVWGIFYTLFNCFKQQRADLFIAIKDNDA